MRAVGGRQPELSAPGDDPVNSRRRGPHSLTEEAVRCQPVFCGRRLRAMRDLAGLAQGDLAAAVGITPAALSQAEHNRTRLSTRHLAAAAAALDVSPEAFVAAPETPAALAPQLRQPRRVSAAGRRRSAQIAAAAARLRHTLNGWVRLPEPWSLTCPVDASAAVGAVGDDIERAAAATRRVLGAVDDPPGSLVRPLAAAGIVVVRDTDADASVGAYSAVVGDVAVIVTTRAASWDQDNLDIAHALGHIVMHRGSRHPPGGRCAEQQARRYAAALLAPHALLADALLSDPNSGNCIALKHRLWMPAAEIMHRAHILGVVTDAQHKRFLRHRSAYGWTRQEPGSSLHPLPAGEPLPRAARTAQTSLDTLTERALLPRRVVALLCEQPANGPAAGDARPQPGP